LVITTLREPLGWPGVRLVENVSAMGEGVGDATRLGDGVGDDLAAELGEAVVDPQAAAPALRIMTAPTTVVSFHETTIRRADRCVADRDSN
jgi:hypothetical protein